MRDDDKGIPITLGINPTGCSNLWPPRRNEGDGMGFKIPQPANETVQLGRKRPCKPRCEGIHLVLYSTRPSHLEARYRITCFVRQQIKDPMDFSGDHSSPPHTDNRQDTVHTEKTGK